MNDQQLWRASIGGQDIRASLHDLHACQDSGDVFSAELRITRDDELIVRELFHDARRLHLRSMEWFEKICREKAD